MSQGNEKPENTRICEDCKKNKTISPKHSLCASCMARRSNKSRHKNQGPGKPKGKEKGQGMHKGVIVDTGLYLDAVFGGKYSYLVKELEKVAEEEIRTLDAQTIYILKSYLSNKEHSGNIK